MSDSYAQFLARKRQLGGFYGFDPLWMPEFLFPFQRSLVDWALRKGKAAIFADCGLGKTPMQLVWAENIVRQSNMPVLIGTPLAVSHQLMREANKFGIEAAHIQDGAVPPGARVVVTNYERLSKFDPTMFGGMVADESSILKSFNGTRRQEITGFMRQMKYRLLCTATAAPNDYTELGTSSEALGELGYMDMLARFFRNQQNNSTAQGRAYGQAMKWRLKGHARVDFWRWICSWARACRKPSDLGYEDDGFILPGLDEREHIVKARNGRPGYLFDLPATNMREEREERRRTIAERVERVAGLVDHGQQALVWCHLNDEGDALAAAIQGAEQVKGADSDERKETLLTDFAEGRLRVLVTKPKIGAWGLNLQNCAHVTFFPSHSYEQYYQGVRRCWRFGQTRPVVIDVVSTEGEHGILGNLRKKAAKADAMFTALVSHMNDSLAIASSSNYTRETEVPAWM